MSKAQTKKTETKAKVVEKAPTPKAVVGTPKTTPKAAAAKKAPVKKSAAKEGDEKSIGDSPNIATHDAGLTFNVNSFKQWMKEQFKIMVVGTPKLKTKTKSKAKAKADEDGKEKEDTGEENNDDNEKDDDDKKKSKSSESPVPKLNGAHIALAAANEALCSYIIKETIVHVPKEKTGLYTLGRASLIVSAQLDTDLKRFFSNHLEVYDSDTNFINQYCVPQKNKNSVEAFILKHFGGNVHLDNTGYNLLAYMLLKFSSQITKTAHALMMYAGRGMLEPNSIYTAVKIACPEGLSNNICMRIEDAIKNSGDQRDKKKDEKENTSDEATTQSKKQTTKKQTGDDNDEVEEEAAVEEEAEEAEEVEEVEEAEEVEEVEVKPAKKAAAKKQAK